MSAVAAPKESLPVFIFKFKQSDEQKPVMSFGDKFVVNIYFF